MKRVLFVCTGNICRSPAGEGVLEHLVHERGLQAAIQVDSAGTHGYHIGELADPRMRAAASARGYRLSSRARQVEPEDFEEFDLVLALDRSHRRFLEDLAGGPRANVRLYSEFLPTNAPRDIPDPYYGGAEGFEEVLDLMEEGCPSILDHVLGEA